MPMYRYQIVNGNYPGGPGVNSLFVNQETPTEPGVLNEVGGLLETAYTSVKSYLWNASSQTFDGVVTEIDPETGDLVRVHAVDSWTLTNTGPSAAGSTALQAKLRFTTDKTVPSSNPLHGPRILKGGIYLGPLADAAMVTNGQLNAAFVAAASTMFDGLMDLVGEFRLVVWHRPKARAGGDYGNVQAVGVKPVPAVLRSRRD